VLSYFTQEQLKLKFVESDGYLMNYEKIKDFFLQIVRGSKGEKIKALSKKK